jgi:hypothetical protein
MCRAENHSQIAQAAAMGNVKAASPTLLREFHMKSIGSEGIAEV